MKHLIWLLLTGCIMRESVRPSVNYSMNRMSASIASNEEPSGSFSFAYTQVCIYNNNISTFIPTHSTTHSKPHRDAVYPQATLISLACLEHLVGAVLSAGRACGEHGHGLLWVWGRRVLLQQC